MKLIEAIGAGGFADVWKAMDDLDRVVAVKVFHDNGPSVSTALDHARALARVTHPNAVRVHNLAKIEHPTTKVIVDCVVMELIEGPTLTELLRGPLLPLNSTHRMGLALIAGLEAIHLAGMTHGDLHDDNVIVSEGEPRIIDILYRGTLAALSPGSRTQQVQGDLRSVRLILSELLQHTEDTAGEAVQFNSALTADSTIADIRDAWSKTTDPALVRAPTAAIAQAITRMSDRDYIEGDGYARALAADIPERASAEVLIQVLGKRLANHPHFPLLQLLCERLSPEETKLLADLIGAELERETPGGAWQSGLILLRALGRKGWVGLSPAIALRLEHLLVNDVMSGHFDRFSPLSNRGGVLGTYCKSHFIYFKEPERLFENLLSMLRQNWYTQNYVAVHFLQVLDRLANTPEKRELALSALRSAVSNDAREVVERIQSLPGDWSRPLRAQLED